MIKRFDDNPKVNDRVEFILLTPDANDCFTENVRTSFVNTVNKYFFVLIDFLTLSKFA